MDDPNENEISSFKRFLEVFCRNVTVPSTGGNDSSIRYVSYKLEPSEIEGESLQWALDYLCQTHDCPHGLAEHISREAFKRSTQLDLHRLFDNSKEESSSSSSSQRIEIRKLQQTIEVQVNKVCQEWNQQLPPKVGYSHPILPVSVHAIKNTRRRMEDRHVILPDLNTLFQLQDSPSQSYYAVFDGHGGAEAAMFSASQLHINLLRDVNFNSSPELALKRAYAATDKQFLQKAEEQKLRSGTTGVNMLMKGDNCYVSWLGDSQVMLVREGRAVTLMEPHKPNREDERKRIEELGGSVNNNFGGVWRVNGNVSVSRAIGDMNMKPFLCSDADVASFTLTGTEDYAVLGCDGVWDVLEPVDIPFLVHSYLQQNPNDHRNVAKSVVAKAKEMGSGDNISCIVVFFRKDIAEPVGLQLEGFQFVRENGEHQECASEISGSHLGSGASMTSGSTGISRLTLNSASGASDSVDSVQRNSLYARGQQIQGDFPHKLERQTGFFLPSLRSLRTGHHRQQLVPLTEGKRSRAESASQDAVSLDMSKKNEHTQKPKSLSKGSIKRGPIKRKFRTRRRRGRQTRTDSPDSSMTSVRDSVSVDQNGDEDLSLSSFAPSHNLETLAKHASLAEILQQMTDPVDENHNPNRQDFLSVRGLSARLHQSLPRIPSRTSSSLLNSTTAMTPVTTSRLSVSNQHQELPRSYPQPKGKSRPYNI